MPENDTSVLCRGISSTSVPQCDSAIFGRSHSVDVPILKYIQEIEHLHKNLIKIRAPVKTRASQVPVGCRLVIVPKARQKKHVEVPEVPFDSIVISRPLMKAPCGEPEKLPSPEVASATTTITAAAPTAETERNNSDRQKPKIEATTAAKLTEAEQKPARKHIHPCICDLTKTQRDRIENHLQAKAEEQLKFQARVQQIDQEIRLIQQQAEQREEECALRQELWGKDEIGCRIKLRKRTFARRLSRVSLGIKQNINWKKPPTITVKYNKVFEMRKANTKYCGDSISTSLDEPKKILINNVIDSPTNKASLLRKKHVDKWIDEFNKEQEPKMKYPNRPEFVINRSKLWSKD